MGRAEGAMASLVAIPEKERDASTWNDLAAAHYVLACRDESPKQLRMALVAADQALLLDPNMAEARFNRALIVEHFHFRDAAAEAWRDALAVERDIAWAAEARQHLAAVVRHEQTFASEIESRYSRLESGDGAVANALVALDAGDARNFGETDILARWGEAWIRGDRAEAERHRIAARTLAAALATVNQDRMLADAVAAIDRASPAARASLASGHVAFRQGRLLYRPARKPGEAERKLAESAKDLENGSSPLAFSARVYKGVAILGQDRVAEARATFDSLDAAVPAQYLALRAYVQWQVATCLMKSAQWGSTIELLTQAIGAFDRLHEIDNAAYLHDIVSQCYGIVGDRDRASSHRLIALRQLGKVTNYRLSHAMSGMVSDAMRGREWREAMSFLNIQINMARHAVEVPAAQVGSARDKEVLTLALVRRAFLHSHFGEDPDADADLKEASAVAASVDDAALREKLENDCKATAALIEPRPSEAIPMLTELLRFHETKGWRSLLPDFYLRRGRMDLATEDNVAAARDFEAGIAELEMHRESLPVGQERWGVFDSAEELFDEAIALALQSGPERAFQYAERERARSISDLLPAPEHAFDPASLPPDAAIIEYAVLPQKLLLFAVDRSGYRVEEAAVVREDLATLIANFTKAVRGGQPDARAFNVLIGPVRDVVSSRREVVFVPDALTSLIPFAALSDGSGALFREHTIVVAPSARFLEQTRGQQTGLARKKVLIVDNPAAEGMPLLSHAGSEGTAIEREYAGGRRLSGSAATATAFFDAAQGADVIHFAGHGLAGSESAALMLASGNADASTLSRARLPRNCVVVLASCDSARGPVRGAEGVLSVAHAFLQAGATSVIATLWPISDEDAADFFPRLHRHLARGIAPAEALQLAQIEFMNDSRNAKSDLWAAVQAIGH
jgi:CHAT domain-containing protein